MKKRLNKIKTRNFHFYNTMLSSIKYYILSHVSSHKNPTKCVDASQTFLISGVEHSTWIWGSRWNQLNQKLILMVEASKYLIYYNPFQKNIFLKRKEPEEKPLVAIKISSKEKHFQVGFIRKSWSENWVSSEEEAVERRRIENKRFKLADRMYFILYFML